LLLPLRGGEVSDLAVDRIGVGPRKVVGPQDHHLDGRVGWRGVRPALMLGTSGDSREEIRKEEREDPVGGDP
jgi:hypothetical protein